METKRQHYYPRCLLKHFANDNDMIHTYIIKANKINNMKYVNACMRNYAYESNDGIDNILERILGKYESKVCPVIDYILKNFDSNSEIIISKEDEDTLYQYMYLQFLRTDAGRIHFITLHENLFSYKPRNKPIELNEIYTDENQKKIDKFNRVFKQDDNLEKLLNAKTKPDNMNFHIAYSTLNLITSDNPVIATDNWLQIMMPISPYLCIEFQDISMNSSKNLIVQFTQTKSRYLNEANINTANYYVISNNLIDIKLNFYLYNRFNNSSWQFKEPHFKENKDFKYKEQQ